MNISELIDELTKIREDHGNIPVGYDDYNCGYGGTHEVDSVEVIEDEKLINNRNSQTVVRLT